MSTKSEPVSGYGLMPAELRVGPQLWLIARLAGPTVAQMAAYTVMEFINTLMLSRLGPREATAAVNAGILGFALVSLGAGTLALVNTLASQSFGRGNFRDCGRHLWQGVWFSLAFAVLLLPVVGRVGMFFRSFGHEPALVAMESAYLRVTLGGALLQLLCMTLSQFLLATDRPAAVFVAAAVGVTANILASWAMIFGHAGALPTGVVGAAWGRNVGVGVEMTVLMLQVARPRFARRFNVRDWTLRPGYLLELLKLGLPSGVQQMADVMAWSLFANVVIGHFGTRAMEANSFVFRVMLVSFMPAVGLGAAVTALVGRSIGARNLRMASRYAHLGYAVAACYMVVCGVGFFVWRAQLLGLFTVDERIIAMGARIMVFAAAFQFFDSMCIIYSSALRGAGDTLVPGVATAVLNWGLVIGGGLWVARHYPQWGPSGPWASALTFLMALAAFLTIRFVRGGWKKIHLERIEADETALRALDAGAALESVGMVR